MIELCFENDAIGIGASFIIMNKLKAIRYEVSLIHQIKERTSLDINKYLILSLASEDFENEEWTPLTFTKLADNRFEKTKWYINNIC